MPFRFFMSPLQAIPRIPPPRRRRRQRVSVLWSTFQQVRGADGAFPALPAERASLVQKPRRAKSLASLRDEIKGHLEAA